MAAAEKKYSLAVVVIALVIGLVVGGGVAYLSAPVQTVTVTTTFTTTVTTPVTPTPTIAETVVMGTTDKITVLDPAKSYDFFTWEVFNNIFQGLLRYKPGTTELVPGLAESYEVSPDGKVYTFKLRPGLKFSDGTPLTAEVVKYSIERVMNLNLDPAWLVTEFVEKVEAVDELTVKFYLKNPVAFFPALVATVPYFPVNPNEYPFNETAEPIPVSCYGPYKVVSWTRDVEMVLEANPDYWGEPPKTKRFIIKFYKDATSLRLAVEKGEIDIAWRHLLPADIKDIKEKGVLKVIEVPGAFIRYIVINCETITDKRLRQAIAAAIDRQKICDMVFMGTTTPLYSMVPAGMWSHIDSFKDKYGVGPNIELARELLTEAGYSEENKWKIELWYTPTHYGDTEKDVAALLKEQLEATGMIEVELKWAEWATYAAEYIAKGTMPIFLLGWYPDYIDPDDYLTPFMHSEYSPSLGAFYSNPTVDDLLTEARLKVTMEERTPLYEEVQRILAEDCPEIPLFQGVLQAVTQPNVEGVVLDPTMLFRYYLVYKVIS